MRPRRLLNRFFTNPIIIGLIVTVVVYSYFISEEKEHKIANGYRAVACADSSYKVISTLRNINNDEHPDNYLMLVIGSTNKVDFPGRLIPNNTAVTVIDTLKSHPEIVQIYIHRENPTIVNPRNEYLWIWEGYICK